MSVKTLLLGSLALNLAIAAGAVYVKQRSSNASLPNVAVEPAEALRVSDGTETVASAAATSSESSTQEGKGWSQLLSKDLKIYIERLRAVNCPEQTIRDIVTGEVNRLFAQRVRSIVSPNNAYWNTENSPWNSGQQKKIRAIDKEKVALLRELLGPDPDEESNREMQMMGFWDRTLDFLPAEKMDRAVEIQEKYNELQQEIYSAGGMIDAEDRKKLREINEKKLAELATFLSPEEVAEYEIRSSQLSMQLRHDLELFEPTESDFRQIYAIRKAREEDLTYSGDPNDKEANDRREKAIRETDAQIKALLGDERFQAYKRAGDWNYREMLRLVDRLELPRESAAKVYTLKKDVEDLAAKIRSSSEYTPEQRKEELKKLRQQTQTAITETLGDAGWKKYNERQGWWLNNISSERANR